MSIAKLRLGAQEEVFEALKSVGQGTALATSDDMIKCAGVLNNLKVHKKYACLPSTTVSVIDGLIVLVLATAEPTVGSRCELPGAGMSTIMQMSLDITGNWLATPVDVKKNRTWVREMLQGSDAANSLFMKLERVEPSARPDSYLNIIRSFQWLLGPRNRQVLEAWVEAKVRDTKNTIEQGMINDAPKGSGVSGACSYSAGPSSLLSLSLMPKTWGRIVKPIIADVGTRRAQILGPI